MREPLTETTFFNVIPSYEELARVHISATMSPDHLSHATATAQSYEDTRRPMANTAVIIPVAAHQDSGYIYHCMSQYAEQKHADPFTIFLYLNHPDTGRRSEVHNSLHETARAAHDFPHLDIRASMATYENATIGEIRRDAWDGVLLLAYHEGALSEHDVLGLNHDIDTTYISPHYIARVQQFYKQREARARSVHIAYPPGLSVGTRVTHATLPTHPNVGKVTTWVDNSYFQAPHHISYEAGLVIPLSLYTLAGGFDAKDHNHETAWSTQGKYHRHLTGAHLYTSPRRYIDRVHEHGINGIWTPETFGTSDACRDVLKNDISFEAAEEIILETIDDDILNYWVGRALWKTHKRTVSYFNHTLQSNADARLHRPLSESIERQLSKAQRLLKHVIGSTLLAEIVQDYDARKLARNYYDIVVAEYTARD